MENSKGYKENLWAGPGIIRTVSGIYVDVINPKPEQIEIEDIAHALSNQCRFGGHLPKFYSVAQHSYRCAQIAHRQGMPEEMLLAALMHDASEAYLLDIPAPIKPFLTGYKEIEDRLMKVISKKFGFTWPLHPDLHQIDIQALNEEWDNIMLCGKDPKIFIWTRDVASSMFIQSFKSFVPWQSQLM